MGLIIQKLSGRVYNLEDLGIFEEERLLIGFPNSETNTDPMEGSHGVVDDETFLRERSLKAQLILLSDRLEDMARIRSEIFRLFDAREKFYLIESRDPGKRWLVKCTSSYSIAEIATIGRFTLDFTSFKPFSESILLVTRQFNNNVFSYKNNGEIIDMRTQTETEIEFKGASSSLTITNVTTGDVWKYNGSTASGDTLLIKGVRSLKNGSSVFGQTNKKMISFAPGWNDFEISGATDFTLTIRTRFYFL